MANNQTTIWNTLQEMQNKIFFGVSALYFLFVILVGLNAFTAMTIAPVWIIAVLMPANALALLALLGFYPQLKEHQPGLMKAELIVAAIAGLGILTIFVGATIFGDPEALSGNLGNLMSMAFFAAMLGTHLTFALFAVTALLTKALSRSISLLLLATPIAWVILVTLISTTGIENDVLDVPVYILIAAFMIALGTLVSREGESEERLRESIAS